MYFTAKYFSYLVNIFPHVPKGKPEQYSAKQWLLCFLLKHIKPSFIPNLTTFPFYESCHIIQCFLVLCLEWLYRKCSSLEKNQDFPCCSHMACQRRAGIFFQRSARETGLACALLSMFLEPEIQVASKTRVLGCPPKTRHASFSNLRSV